MVNLGRNVEGLQLFLISTYNFGQRKNSLLFENYLLVRNFLKHAGFPLVLRSPVILGEKFFHYRDLLVSEKFVYNVGFSPVVLRSPPSLRSILGEKVLYLSFSRSFIRSRFV